MASNEKFYVTQEGYNDLQRELDNLIHVVRQEVIIELQEARAQGDLSENADYDAARDHQAQVEARIRELEALLKKAEIIDESQTRKNAVVHIGSEVTLKDLSDGTVNTYTIVGTIEADPFENKISMNPLSPKQSWITKRGIRYTLTKFPYPTMYRSWI